MLRGVLGVSVLGLLASAGLSGCIFGSEECIEGRRRCTAEGRELCVGGEGYTHWTEQACEADAPFCVQTEPEPSLEQRVECAAEPHCSATSACERFGLCADAAYGCAPTAEGCAQACHLGRCGFNGTECVATKEGCANDARCKAKGLCAVGARDCRATAAGCAVSDFCKSDGYCGFASGLCERTLEGCKASDVCRTDGWCGFSTEGGCDVTADGCANSEACSISGRCFAVDGTCKASAESCAASFDCAEREFCRLQANGTCYL